MTTNHPEDDSSADMDPPEDLPPDHFHASFCEDCDTSISSESSNTSDPSDSSDRSDTPPPTAPSLPPPPPPSPWLFWLRAALIPTVIILLFVGYKPIKRSSLSMGYPYQLDREEGFLLLQAIRIAGGETIYPSLDDYPYIVGNYPPVYPAIVAGLIGILPPSLPLGRLVVMLSTLVLVALIVNIILRDTNELVPALLAAGLFLATWDLNNWIAFARVDLTGIMFSLAGICAITSPRRRSGFAFALIAFTAAFFTKQTQVIAPAAVAVAFLIRRDFSTAGMLSVGLIVAAVSFSLMGNSITDGEYLRHTILYNANEFHWNDVFIWTKHLVTFGLFKFLAIAMLIAALWGLTGQLRNAASNGFTPPSSFDVAAFFLLFSAIGVTSVGKAGSACNYLLEFHAAAALFAGLWFGRLFSTVRKLGITIGRSRVALAAVAICLLTLHAADTLLRTSRYYEPGPAIVDRELISRVQLEVDDTEGDILSEHPIFPILARREVLYQPFIMSQLAREKKWDDSKFVADIRNQRFKLIITLQDIREDGYFPGFTQSMVEAMRAHYQFKRTYSTSDATRITYYIYVPAGEAQDDQTGRTAAWIASRRIESVRFLAEIPRPAECRLVL